MTALGISPQDVISAIQAQNIQVAAGQIGQPPAANNFELPQGLIGFKDYTRAELLAEYAKERQQFGQAIGNFQMVGQMLADSAIEINAARLMVWQAAWMMDQGEAYEAQARDMVAMVKVHAAEMLGRVVDRAVQIFGGMGFCKDLPIERYYRDARIYRIYDGTSEIHRTVIARSLAKRGAALFDVHR